MLASMTHPAPDSDPAISPENAKDAAEAAARASKHVVEGKTLRDAIVRQRVPALDDGASGIRRKQTALLRRAMKSVDDNPKKALEIAHKALELDTGFAQANHIVGLLHDRQGLLSRALEYYEAAWRLDPEDVEIYQNLGLAAWRLDMLEGAEKFFRIGRSKQPGRVEDAVNLAGVLRDQAKFDDAIEVLRQGIYLNQSEELLWNALGTVLMESGDPAQAETFYREALSLNPQSARVHHNLAYALDIQGDLESALDLYEKAIALRHNPHDAAQSEYGRSFAKLAVGDLEQGWDGYDVRMQPAYNNATIFVVAAPRWDRKPDSVAGKRVLLIGEQGLGDEVLFMNAARDLERAIGPDGQMLIACEKRLVPLIGRAFPDAIVGPHVTFSAEARKFRTVPWLDQQGGADMWTPAADPVCVWRRSVESFPDETGFLKPDPARVQAMRAQLAALGPGLKVGVVWKSMLMTPSRAKYFSPFSQWAPVLRTPGVTFVNLQYGEVDAELARARDEYGVEIHQLDGLNVKDDLDGVAALGAVLDLSIGPMTASTNLAAAAGGDVWILAYQRHWPGLGTGRMPWYPQARTISPDGWGKWDTAMKTVAAELGARAAAAARTETPAPLQGAAAA